MTDDHMTAFGFCCGGGIVELDQLSGRALSLFRSFHHAPERVANLIAIVRLAQK